MKVHCKCKNKNLDLSKGNILLITGKGENFGPDWYFEHTCLKCGKKEDIYNRKEKACYVIDCANTNFPSECYINEYNIIIQLLKNHELFEETTDLQVYLIMKMIIDSYNDYYYNYFYKFTFNVVRKAILKVVIGLNLTTSIPAPEVLLKKLKSVLEYQTKNFDIYDFLNNWNPDDPNSCNQLKYGPCAIGLLTVLDDYRMVDSLNAKWLKKRNFEINKETYLSKHSSKAKELDDYFCEGIKKFLTEEFIYQFNKFCDERGIKVRIFAFNEYIRKIDKELYKSNALFLDGYKKRIERYVSQASFRLEEVTYENYDEIKNKLDTCFKIVKIYL